VITGNSSCYPLLEATTVQKESEMPKMVDKLTETEEEIEK